MKFTSMLQAAYDFWRPNRYSLKPFLINDGQKHPFVVICPGGSYSMVCSFVEGKPIAKELNIRGYHAFVVYYHVKKKAKYPNPQLDLKKAVEEILNSADKWNIAKENWLLIGSSAGGHLAASYCLEKYNKPSCLILSYPVITMGKYSEKNTVKNLLGNNPTEAMVNKLSVDKNVTKEYPPTFIWAGDLDTLVDPVHNGQALFEALKSINVPCEFKLYKDVAHGVGLAEGTSAEHWLESALDFWERNSNT